MYLLDTDTIIYNLKGNAAVQSNLRKHLHDPIKISVITYMELYSGAYKSQRRTANLAIVKNLGQDIEMIPLGIEIAEIFGLLKAKLEQTGTPLDDFDLAIAATAMVHNLTLVTNNTQHFQRIEGIKLENWQS
jgi:tRNA(fMet)-specific endonuclease VapC